MPFPPAARESSVSLLLEEVGGGSKERVPAMITLFAANSVGSRAHRIGQRPVWERQEPFLAPLEP